MKLVQKGPYLFQTFWKAGTHTWEATSLDIPGFKAQSATYEGLNRAIDRLVCGM